MNSPLRWATQRFLDIPFFLAQGGPFPVDGRYLEIGCGNGRGAAMVLAHTALARLDAFDLDIDQIVTAKRRLAAQQGQVALWVGDVEQMPLPAATYDAVFDFGILHHVPNWQGAVAEVHRVLKPGGRFLVFEVLEAFVCHPLWRQLMLHPQTNRFNSNGFRAALENAGFNVLASRHMLDQFAWFVGEKK